MKSLLLKCTAIVLLFAMSGFAQDVSDLEEAFGSPNIIPLNINYSGTGARAAGMGNAFLGLSDDVTAPSWNPAGLFNLDQPILSLSYTSTLPRGETSTDLALPTQPSTLNHNGSIDGISGINFVAPLRIKGQPFVGSFSYAREYDEYWSTLASDSAVLIYQPTVQLDTTIINGITEQETAGKMNSVAFGLATRIYRSWSAGVTLNIYTGDIVRDAVNSTVIDSLTRPTGDVVRQVDKRNVLDSLAFSGYNFTVGFKLNKEKFGFGLVLQTPFDLEVETDRSVYLVRTQNGLPTEAGSDTVFFDNLLAKYEMPWMLGVGFAFRPNEKLTLALDGEYRNFGSQAVLLRDSLFLDPGGENEEFFTEIPGDDLWKNTFHARVGAEYMTTHDWARIPIRVGFGYVPSFVPSINEALETELTTSWLLTLGAGIWWSQIHFDIAYAYQTRDLEIREISLNEAEGVVESAGWDIQNKDHSIRATFTGYF